MSKIIKKLVLLLIICLSTMAFFACGTTTESKPESEESVSVQESVSEGQSEESEEESEEETESNFTVELPEVGRM